MKLNELYGKKEIITGTVVNNYFNNQYYLWCNLFAPNEGKDPESDFHNMISLRGQEHEKLIYREKYPGLEPAKVETTEEVLSMLRAGPEVLANLPIFDLKSGFLCKPDLLLKIASVKSNFGDFVYIIKEIKSAKNIKKKHIMQACFSNMVLGIIQGVTPQYFYLINKEGEEKEYSFDQYKAELILALKEIRDIIAGKEVTPTFEVDYPWTEFSRKQAIEYKDISLVNGIGPSKKSVLNKYGFNNINDLNKCEENVLRRIKGFGPKTVRKVKLYSAALLEHKPIILCKVNFPKVGTEVFLDLEGTQEDTEYDLVNVDYLIGVLVRRESSEKYISFLAKTPEEEEKMLREFLEWISKLDDFIIYHFHHYEKNHLLSLFKRYQITPELQNKIINKLVDLKKEVDKSIVLPIYKAGLKEIADHLGFKWRHKDVNAMESMAWYIEYLQNKDEGKLKKIIDYNEDDCRATMVVKDYLSNI